MIMNVSEKLWLECSPWVLCRMTFPWTWVIGWIQLRLVMPTPTEWSMDAAGDSSCLSEGHPACRTSAAAVTPCGLRGCKNRPTPFPGRMSCKTRPCLSFCDYSFYCVVVCYYGHILCIVSLCWYVFCLLVVLVKLSVLAKWLDRKTPLRKPNCVKGIVSTKPRLKSSYDFLGLLYYFIVQLKGSVKEPTITIYFFFSAHQLMVFCFWCSIYWWKGSVRL